MIRFLLRRAAWGLITLFVFLTIMFFATQILIPGDYASQFAMSGLGRAALDEMRHEMGLDLPLWQRYFVWLRNLFRGNLGLTYGGAPVFAILQAALPVTCLVFVSGTAIAFALGQWLGKVTVWGKAGRLATGSMFGAILLYTTFPPWLVWLVLLVFGPLINLLRRMSGITYSRALWRTSPLSPQAVMWFMMLTVLVLVLVAVAANRRAKRMTRRRLRPAWYLLLAAVALGLWFACGFGPQSLDILYFAILPIASYVLLTFGEIMLIMQTSMRDTLNEDYVQTARAKGLDEAVVRDRHAARNALLPVLSRLVISLPYLLTGLVFIEYSFGFSGMGAANLFRTYFQAQEVYWLGVGTLLFGALSVQDIPVAMGTLLLVGVIFMAARLFLEVMYAYLDPRIRFGARGMRRGPDKLRQRAKRGKQPRLPAGWGLDRKATKTGSLLEQFSACWRHLRLQAQSDWRRVKKGVQMLTGNRLVAAGVVLVAIFGLMAIAHPILIATVWPGSVYDPQTGYDADIFQHPSQPSARHLLGTDVLGRDVLSMLLAATTPTFALGLIAAATTAVIGSAVGAVAAYWHGRAPDTLLTHLADVLLLAPAPLVMVVVGARFRELGSTGFGLIYGLLAGLGGAAIVMKSHALKVINKPFIEAARVAGSGSRHIILRHLVPHMLPMAALYMMLTVTGAVVADGFIAFFGLTRVYMNWGAMIYQAFTYSNALGSGTQWHMLVPPSVALSLFAAAFYLIARGLHEIANPQLRHRQGDVKIPVEGIWNS